MAKKSTKSNLSTQLPWKYLPVVLILLFIPALPSILTRHTTRESAQDILKQQSQADTEFRQYMVSTIATGSPSLSEKDVECVVVTLIDAHTISGLRQMLSSSPVQSPYTPIVKTELQSRCNVQV